MTPYLHHYYFFWWTKICAKQDGEKTLFFSPSVLHYEPDDNHLIMRPVLQEQATHEKRFKRHFWLHEIFKDLTVIHQSWMPYRSPTNSTSKLVNREPFWQVIHCVERKLTLFPNSTGYKLINKSAGHCLYMHSSSLPKHIIERAHNFGRGLQIPHGEWFTLWFCQGKL